MKAILSLTLPLALGVIEAPAQSTIDPAQPYVWGANIGWLNARPSSGDGVRTYDMVCSGYIWSGNVGWIHLGDGTPADGIRYSNTAGDCGVNVMADGTLRGFAWGPNIGWVNFEETGNPRISLVSGNLGGYAYGSNVGWLDLAADTARITQLAITDTDNDEISDAWEREQASGSLAILGNPGDADGDGQSDLAEFTADTDPLNAEDRLRIIYFDGSGPTTELSFTSRATRFYEVTTSTDLSSNPWTDVGLGAITGQPDQTSASFPGSASDRRFYRVETKRPLGSP
jgi:hypothetical protein